MSFRPAAFSFAALLTLAAPAFAAWTTDPTVNTRAAETSLPRALPAMIPDGSSGMFVVWTQNFSEIRAQHLDARGDAQWGLDGVSVATGGFNSRDSAVVASDGAGGMVIAWRDLRSGNADVYAQRMNASGVPLWTANGVAVCTDASAQGDIAITDDDSLGAVVAWRDMRHNATGGSDLYAQRILVTGAPAWAIN